MVSAHNPTSPLALAGHAPARRLAHRLAYRLAYGYLGLAGVTYILVVLGALVRAHGAGLACPDWPLCFGEVIPQFDFKVAFEWGHRVLAGSVGIVFAVLAGLTLRDAALRPRMLVPVGIAAVLLATQVVLGGLTVLELLATWTVTSHLVTGNAFALALVLLSRRLFRLSSDEHASLASGTAVRTGTAAGRVAATTGTDGRTTGATEANSTQRVVTSLAGVLLAVQIVLGGLVSSSYAGLVCPDWPTCMNGEFAPTWSGIQGLHVFHRTVGYITVFAIAAAAWLARSHAGSRRWLLVAAIFAACQVAVGVANVLLRLPVEVTATHSALAAGLVCTMGVSVREVWRSA